MTEKIIDTEAQRIIIDLLIGEIRMACAALFDKKEELEKQVKDEQNIDAITIIKLRLDTLAKVELKLMQPVKEIYEAIGNRTVLIRPGDLTKRSEARSASFIAAIMQGL